jgi:hypothetical protein
MVKLLSRSPTGQKIVAESFYANFKTNELLGKSYAPVSLKGTDKKIVYKGFQKLYLEPVKLQHLIKSSADIPSPAFSADLKTLTVAAPLVIDGVGVDAGEEIVMSKAIATTLKTSPGIWRADSQTQLTLINPPIYTMDSAWNISFPWAYRVDDNGDLIGLRSVVPQNQVITQGAIRLNQSASFLDGNYDSFNDGGSLSGNQTATVSFTPLEFRRAALRATSRKLRQDANMPSASFTVRNQSGPIAESLQNYRTKQWARTGAFEYARGQSEDWLTDDTLKTWSAVTITDAGGSRSYSSMMLFADGPCQFSIAGETPTNGSTVIVPEYVANAFFPAIVPGNYLVVENAGGSTQWRLRKL